MWDISQDTVNHSQVGNIWAAFIILSPYLGPMLTAFIMTTQKWPIAFWVYFVMVRPASSYRWPITSLTSSVTDCFGPRLHVEETFYDRRIAPSDQPSKGTRLQQILGISQYRSRHRGNSFSQACSRPIRVIIKPTVFLSSLYYTLTFAWVVGINTTLSIFLTPLYNFGPLQIIVILQFIGKRLRVKSGALHFPTS